MNEHTCRVCNKKFTSTRPHAEYCSANCRVKASRKIKVEKDVTREVKKAINKEIDEVQFQKDGVTIKGKFIPEAELNSFYRGKKGKLALAMDLVSVKYFNRGAILFTEKQRLAVMDKKVKRIQ